VIVNQGTEDGHFRPREEFFDEETTVTKSAVDKDFLQEGFSASFVRANGNAFASSQAIKLENGGIDTANEATGIVNVSGYFRHARGDLVAQKEILSEFLTGFQLSALLDRTPAGDARFLATIGKAFILDQIAFFASNAEVNAFGLHLADKIVHVRGINLTSKLIDGIASRETENFRS
jgi:hypothetical protein